MRQRVRVHRVRTGNGEVRVLRAEPGPGRLALRDDHHWFSMYADLAGAEQLTALWSLAARSARSLVHLPIRANQVPDGVESGGEPVALDLVLLHHSLQFPVSSWKRLRSRLGRGELHTASTPDDDLPGVSDIDHERRRHREYRDHLDFDVAAHTLFVKGSARAFREHGAQLRRLVEEGPLGHVLYPDALHHCVEIDTNPRSWGHARGNVSGTLHIQYCDPWTV